MTDDAAADPSLDPEEPSSLRNAWLTWLLVTLGLALYAGGAEIEARTESEMLVLTPGNEIVLSVPRLFANPLQLDLDVHTPACEARPDPVLGAAMIAPPRDGLLRLKPDAGLKLEVRVDDGPPTPYELMPPTGSCLGTLRRLTANLAVEPGVYRWPPPPETPQLMLGSGFNEIHVKVVSADKPIAGQRTMLYVLASVRLNGSQPNVDWLWPAVFLDLLFPVTQGIWLLVLLWKTLRRNRA
jgi:hypothetical protein